MKKFFSLLIVSLFVVSFMATVACAAEMKGTVKSIDAAKGTFVLNCGGKDTTLKGDKALIGSLKAKASYKVTYEGDTAKSVVKDRGAKVPVGC